MLTRVLRKREEKYWIAWVHARTRILIQRTAHSTHTHAHTVELLNYAMHVCVRISEGQRIVKMRAANAYDMIMKREASTQNPNDRIHRLNGFRFVIIFKFLLVLSVVDSFIRIRKLKNKVRKFASGINSHDMAQFSLSLSAGELGADGRRDGWYFIYLLQKQKILFDTPIGGIVGNSQQHHWPACYGYAALRITVWRLCPPSEQMRATINWIASVDFIWETARTTQNQAQTQMNG